MQPNPNPLDGSTVDHYPFFAATFLRLVHIAWERRLAFARISGVQVAPFLWFGDGTIGVVVSLAEAAGLAVLRAVPAREVPGNAAIAASIFARS